MLASRIFGQVWEVDDRLRPFGFTRPELVSVAAGVVAARADTVENDPATAEGQFAYIFGTRFLRSLCRTKGYHLHRRNNIEAVKHPDRELKIIYQSVDLAASLMHVPKAVSGKGTASEEIIGAAQGSLFTDEELAAAHAVELGLINTGVWYYCVSVNGDDVRAELSLPTRIVGNQFQDFIERIFIIREGEWEDLIVKSETDSGSAEFEPVVTRK